MDGLSAWLALLVMGAYHGLNPGMGWLFAVALGLQQQDDRAIRRALIPISLGHMAALAMIAALLGVGQAFWHLGSLRSLTALALVAFGSYKLFRYSRHPRWFGMRVNAGQLFAWSFLMAGAHGAGLMAAPFLLGLGGVTAFAIACAAQLGLDHSLPAALRPEAVAPLAVWAAAIGLHTLAMLGVMALVAHLVYRKFGLMVLRWGWINFDLIWAAALLVVGGIAFVHAV